MEMCLPTRTPTHRPLTRPRTYALPHQINDVKEDSERSEVKVSEAIVTGLYESQQHRKQNTTKETNKTGSMLIGEPRLE